MTKTAAALAAEITTVRVPEVIERITLDPGCSVTRARNYTASLLTVTARPLANGRGIVVDMTHTAADHLLGALIDGLTDTPAGRIDFPTTGRAVFSW